MAKSRKSTSKKSKPQLKIRPKVKTSKKSSSISPVPQKMTSEKYMVKSVGLFRLMNVISILLFTYFLVYLHKLESTGCECAKNWRRDYIMAYCVFSICVLILNFVIVGNLTSEKIRLLRLISLATFVLNILFVIFTFQYVHSLKRTKCQCSENLARTIMYIVAFIDAVIYAIVGIFILMMIILMAFNKIAK